MTEQNTFAICKPGVLQRRILGDIIGRIENKGFQLRALRLRRLSRELCEEHYAEHRGRDFYEALIEYMTSAPVVIMVLSAENAIARFRALCGATRVEEAAAGTIRGDFAASTRMNIVHASDSEASAEREIGLFFTDEEIVDYEDELSVWLA